MIIGHYDSEFWEKGGVLNYVRRVGAAQFTQGHQVYYFSRHPPAGCTVDLNPFIAVADTADLFQQAQSLGLDILHLHKAVSPPLPHDLPLIRTLHGHHPYCPSGGKLFKRWQQLCDRPYSVTGCLWGCFVGRCGSIRPHRLQDNFRHTAMELATLPQIPVMAVSQFLKDQMIQSGYPAEMIRVLYLFASSTANYIPPPVTGTPRFLFLGRIAHNKGVDWLLKSLQQVTVPFHLDIAGDGTEAEPMRQLAAKLGILDRVTFHGWVDTTQAEALIQQSRALIFPSTWHEPGGTVAFEAMAHGRAVIMSRVGGMPEVIQTGVNGIVVEPWNEAELANAMQRLAQDLKLASHLGQEGRRILTEDYTLDLHLAQLVAAYEQAIASKQKSAVASFESPSSASMA